MPRRGELSDFQIFTHWPGILEDVTYSEAIIKIMRIAEQEINADNKTSRHLWKSSNASFESKLLEFQKKYKFQDQKEFQEVE